MEKAQVIKELKALKEAFEEERDAYPICLGEAIRLLKQPEIITCKECRWHIDQSNSTSWLPCKEVITSNAYYCASAERRTDERSDFSKSGD